MHPNSVYRRADKSTAILLARQIGFGTLIVAGDDILTCHVPFVLNAEGQSAELHLVRSNPTARLLKNEGDCVRATLIIQGPHAYISPDWYGLDDEVPTWNYVAVRINGRLEALTHSELRQSIDTLSAHFEAQVQQASGKPIWTSDKMSEKVLIGMMKAIRPFRVHVDAVESTYKLNQNKPPEAIVGATSGLESSNVGSEIETLRKLMLNPPSP